MKIKCFVIICVLKPLVAVGGSLEISVLYRQGPISHHLRSVNRSNISGEAAAPNAN
jgi:hypothetical protein